MKFSANIPDDLLQFLDHQVEQGHYKSRSAAIADALHEWRSHRLMGDYREAFAEVDDTWDVTVSDGLAIEDSQ